MGAEVGRVADRRPPAPPLPLSLPAPRDTSDAGLRGRLQPRDQDFRREPERGNRTRLAGFQPCLRSPWTWLETSKMEY